MIGHVRTGPASLWIWHIDRLINQRSMLLRSAFVRASSSFDNRFRTSRAPLMMTRTDIAAKPSSRPIKTNCQISCQFMSRPFVGFVASALFCFQTAVSSVFFSRMLPVSLLSGRTSEPATVRHMATATVMSPICGLVRVSTHSPDVS